MINTLYRFTFTMAALPPRAQAWQRLCPSDALRARVKAYVPASPHFHAHYEAWKLYTQKRTDAQVMHYLFYAAKWLDASGFPTSDEDSGSTLREDVWFNAACIKIFEIERNYELREIELHLINWNTFGRPDDIRESKRDEYLRGVTYLRVEGGFIGGEFTHDPHSTILSNMDDVEDIDVDYMCRALRRNKIKLTMTTRLDTLHEVWIHEAKEEENASRVLIAHYDFETWDEYYMSPALDDPNYAEEAEYHNGVLTVVSYGTIDLRSGGPNGWIVDDLIGGPRRADVAATIEQNAPTAPRLTLDIAKLVAEFGTLDVQDKDVFPRPRGHPHDKRKRVA